MPYTKCCPSLVKAVAKHCIGRVLSLAGTLNPGMVVVKDVIFSTENCQEPFFEYITRFHSLLRE